MEKPGESGAVGPLPARWKRIGNPSELNDEVASKTGWEVTYENNPGKQLYFPSWTLMDVPGEGLRYRNISVFVIMVAVAAILMNAYVSGFVVLYALWMWWDMKSWAPAFLLSSRTLTVDRHVIPFGDIHALQLLFDKGGFSPGMQVNAVTRDGKRYFLAKQRHIERARSDAVRISELVGCPVWEKVTT